MSLFARRKAPGTPPGTLPEVSQVAAELAVISYSTDEYEAVKAESVEDCYQQIGKRNVTWIRVEGTKDSETLTKLGQHFGFHPLTLEDIMNGGQRPKVEDFGEYVFIILRHPRISSTDSAVGIEQINIFLGPGYVVTVTDTSETFDLIKQRIMENRGRIRKMNAGYLAYSLIDAVLDSFFSVIESTGNRIEALDDEIQDNPSPEVVRKIREIKRGILNTQAAIWPMREAISSLQSQEPELIADVTKVYLRDAYDSTIQINDMVETYRDILSEMFSVYISVTANSTNEVMKVLTIFAAIFIPLTFMAGIYGMNFDFMPELKWRPAYFILLGSMAIVAIAMLRFFRKRGWL